MINEEKVKLMTKMAAFESSSEGKRAINAASFFVGDYMGKGIIWTEICLTFAYILMLFLVVCANIDTIVGDINKIGYMTVIFLVIFIYVLVLVAGLIGSVLYYKKRHEQLKKYAEGYFTDLKKIERYYRDEDSEGGAVAQVQDVTEII